MDPITTTATQGHDTSIRMALIDRAGILERAVEVEDRHQANGDA